MARVTHGAYSARRVEPLAAALVAEVLSGEDADVRFLRHPMFAVRLWTWARAQAQHELYSNWIADHVPIDSDNVRALHQEVNFLTRAMRTAEAAGLTPVRPPSVEAEILLILRELDGD